MVKKIKHQILDQKLILPVGIGLVILIPFLVPLLGSENYLIQWFSTDDAFYYFKIAGNITQGLGSTFDGISPTNGYHPLWMLVLIPVYFLSGSNPLTPLKVIVIVQYLFLFSAVLIAIYSLRPRVSFYTLVLSGISLVLLDPIFNVVTNGTESAINLFFLVLLWSSLVKRTSNNERFSSKIILKISIISILMLFARLDNIFIISGVGLLLFFQAIQYWNQESICFRLKKGIKVGFTYGLPILFSLAIFFTWNKIFFNSWMPLSGQIKQYWGTLGNTIYGISVQGKGDLLAEFISPDFNLGPWAILTKPINTILEEFQINYFGGMRQVSLGIYLLMGAAALFGFLVSKQQKKIEKMIVDYQIFPLLLGAFFHILYYKIFGFLAQRSWYWVLEMFIIVLLGSITFEAVILSIKKFSWHGFSRILGTLLVLILLIPLLNPHWKALSQLGNSRTFTKHEYIVMAEWIEDKTEPNVIIGMTGAGSTAYFIQNRTIMNIDGLVNGKDYFDSIRVGKGADYLQEASVEYIFANEYVLQETDPYQENYQELLSRSEMIGEFGSSLTLWDLSWNDGKGLE